MEPVGTYGTLSAFAQRLDRSRTAIRKHFGSSSWPAPTAPPWSESDAVKVESYLATKQPDRNYRQQRQPAPQVPPAPSPTIPEPPRQGEEVAAITATLADLERSIRGARSNEEAERLSKQVRALKVVRELDVPERLTPSQTAERYRTLSRRQSSRPGKWDNKNSPALVGIMDLAWVRGEVRKIYIRKAAQVGVSEAARNLLLHMAMREPDPVLLILPDEKTGKR
jgi:hypothetical protein